MSASDLRPDSSGTKTRSAGAFFFCRTRRARSCCVYVRDGFDGAGGGDGGSGAGRWR